MENPKVENKPKKKYCYKNNLGHSQGNKKTQQTNDASVETKNKP